MSQASPGSFAIDWRPQPAMAFACPVCQTAGPKRFVLAVPSPFPSHPVLRLYACDACGSLSYPGVAPPAYATPGPIAAIQAAIKFYVEQGAAPDVMVEPLFWLDRHAIQRYAEVGCGFGFGLDFACEALGWSVHGYDPSPAAAAGRDQWGLPITLDYLGPETLRGVAPYDLLLASEVIEHLSDPNAFLTTLAPAIAPGGWLVLSTPNAAGITPSATPATLLMLLSPGYHLVLFSAASLGRLLDEQGFQHRYLRATSTTLTLVASRQPFRADPGAVLDRRVYRAYLQRRLATLDPDQSLAQGLAGRLFKEQVNAGDYPQALNTFSPLAASIRRRYGLDLDNPERMLAGIPSPSDFARFAEQVPMNLCGLAYRRGFLALHHEQAAFKALSYFRLGESAGAALRQALRDIGADDGETEQLVELCRLGAFEAAVAAQDLQAVRAWLQRFRSAAIPAAWQELAFPLIARCFTDRALAGDYGLAELLAPALPWETPAAVPGRDPHEAARLLLARGLYALNHLGNAVDALGWLTAAHESLQRLMAAGEDHVGELLPTLVTAQLYAQASAAPAEALLNSLIRLPDAAGSTSAHLVISAEVFQRLVHAGAYPEALQLEPQLLSALAASPATLTAPLAFTLGILALNHKADLAAAHGWFIQATQLAPPGGALAQQASQLAGRTAYQSALEPMPSPTPNPPVT